MTRIALWLSSSVALLLLVGLVGPASAGSSVIRDAARDAPSGVDVKSLRVNETPQRVVATVRVRKLARTGVLRLGVGNGGEYYHVVVKKNRKALKTKIGYFDPSGTPGYSGTYECPGLKAQWNRRKGFIRVRIALPRCFSAYAFIDGGRLERRKAQDVVGRFSMQYD